MSFSPVFGRSSAEASAWISLRYFLSISIVTTARPFWRCTPPMSPTRMPAMRTVWPWPGMTAWAVENSALTGNGAAWNGKRKRSWERM